MKVKDNKDHFIHFVEKWFIIGIILSSAFKNGK